MTITIKEVAQQARVSTGTVSNALTRRRPVAEETRQRIFRAIEELGYQPNLVARSLVDRRSYSLAVVIGRLEYYGASRTLVGVESAASELGYSLLLHLVNRPGLVDSAALLTALTTRRVDGVIWGVPELSGEITALSLPIISLFVPPQEGRSIVTMDHHAGAVIATRHLIDEGCRNIGLINGPLSWWVARERQAGWGDALRSAGLPRDDDAIAYGDWSAVSGERALNELLARRPELDAVVAGNDQMALGVLRAAHIRGISVPGELAVVGFDNTPESAVYWPALTTMHLRHMEIGRLAVERLVNLIEAQRDREDKTATVSEVLQPELVVRESSIKREVTL